MPALPTLPTAEELAAAEAAPPPLPDGVAPPPLPLAPTSVPTLEPPSPPTASAPELPLAPPPAVPAAPRTWREFFTSESLRRGYSGFLLSLIVHLLVLLALSISAFVIQPRLTRFALTIAPLVTKEPEPLTMVELPQITAALPGEAPILADHAHEQASVPEIPDVLTDTLGEAESPGTTSLKADNGQWQVEDLLHHRPGSGGGVQGRSDEHRSNLVGQRGGTPASEAAVRKGLAWLAAHQHKNGSWHFDHRGELCDGRCRDPGTAGSTTGATGLALLPFLGAGYTHQRGEYQEVVKQGLYYLQARIRKTPRGGDLMEGTMYAQGIAAIALCEAYAMTGDPDLKPIAQDAIDFICDAQHNGGGWRYFPGQPGDTTVFGWQFMALKSAYLAKLEVPSPVIEKAARYLDSVQTERGAFYGYLKPGKDPTPTAVGLLARMYLGWPREKSELAVGAEHLAKLGPAAEDMYFNYYATQVLHHYEGPQWDKWNTKLREHLIKTQATEGHEAGSWFFPDKHGLSGGRLYTTAMCVMILEVYYRHLPIYGERSVAEGF